METIRINRMQSDGISCISNSRKQNYDKATPKTNNIKSLTSYEPDTLIKYGNRFLSYCRTGDRMYLYGIPSDTQLPLTLHARDNKGNSALMLSVIHQHMDTLLDILHSLSDVSNSTISHSLTHNYLNHLNQYGHSALHLSLLFRSKQMVKALIEGGCDPLLTDGKGQNVFHYIATHNLIGFTGVIHTSLMTRHNNNNNNKESKKRIAREIELGLLSCRDNEGMTPVHIAIERHQQVSLVRELLSSEETALRQEEQAVSRVCQSDSLIEWRELGESLSVLTVKSQSSVLHLAAATGNAMLVECILFHLFLTAGGHVFVNFQDGYGNTALHLAVAINALECVQTLLRYGSYVDIPNDEGDIPIDYSISNEMNTLFVQQKQSNCYIQQKS